MIKKKELREKLQQRQILKRDLNDGPPIPINSGDIQILEERSTSSSAFIQKSTTPTSATRVVAVVAIVAVVNVEVVVVVVVAAAVVVVVVVVVIVVVVVVE